MNIDRRFPLLLVLALAVRFMHFALFGGTLLSLHYYAVDLAFCLLFGFLGFRITLSGTGKELLERPEIRAAYLEGGRQEVSTEAR